MELVQKEIQINFKKTDAIILIREFKDNPTAEAGILTNLLRKGFDL